MTDVIDKLAQVATWAGAVDDALEFAKQASTLAAIVQRELTPFPERVFDVRLHLDSGDMTLCAFADEGDLHQDVAHRLGEKLGRKINAHAGARALAQGEVKLAAANLFELQRQKYARSEVARAIAEAGHVVAGPRNWLPTGANPLASMLAGGILGSAAGYGIGTLGEYVLPDEWQRGKMRRTLAMMGGAMGAAPGVTIGLTNLGRGLPFNDARVQNPISPEEGASALAKAAALRIKVGYDGTGLELSRDLFTPSFSAEYATQQLWQQPLPPQTQAALSGLTLGAQQIASRDAGHHVTLITPLDVAKMTAGMGTGYASGLLVGKALGTFFGASPAAQSTLRRTGLLAGALANLAPVAFRGLQ